MLCENRHTAVYHVKHAVPLTIWPDDGIVPEYQPVLSEPHIFIPGVVKGNIVPPEPLNRIQTGIVRLINGAVLSQFNGYPVA